MTFAKCTLCNQNEKKNTLNENQSFNWFCVSNLLPGSNKRSIYGTNNYPDKEKTIVSRIGLNNGMC